MGHKFTSDTFQISALVTETAPNALTTTQVNLNLDSLSREILVIQMVDLDVTSPNLVAGVRSAMDLTLSDTSPTAIAGLGNSNTIATAQKVIQAGSGAGAGGIEGAVSFDNQEPKFAQMTDAPIFITATDDLFLSIQGSNNTSFQGVGQARIFARRARADADTYAAILTSQFN